MRVFSNSNKYILTECRDFIDGLLLSDGSIGKRRVKGTYSQTCKYSEWLSSIFYRFLRYDIKSNLSFVVRKDFRLEFTLNTLEYDEFGLLHSRWYILDDEWEDASGIIHKRWFKIIPKDIILTPACVCNLYFGDGTLSLRKKYGTYSIYIATMGFSKSDVIFLSELLNSSLGIRSVVTKANNIQVASKSSVSVFLDYIKDCNIPSCYNYKFPNELLV